VISYDIIWYHMEFNHIFFEGFVCPWQMGTPTMKVLVDLGV
jgi:hypothetical protein